MTDLPFTRRTLIEASGANLEVFKKWFQQGWLKLDGAESAAVKWRRYSEADVIRLALMVRLVTMGWPPPSAAGAVNHIAFRPSYYSREIAQQFGFDRPEWMEDASDPSMDCFLPLDLSGALWEPVREDQLGARIAHLTRGVGARPVLTLNLSAVVREVRAKLEAIDGADDE